MRYGKPIKNKKRIDPRYFLNELEVGADVDTVDIEKLLDLTSDKPIFTAQSSKADITGVIEPHETESAALRAAKAVQDEKELPWDWDNLSEHPNLTMDHVLAYPEQPWSWDNLSKHPNITMAHVLACPELWNWNCLSCNPSITFDDVFAHPELPWNWGNISKHPNLLTKK